MTAPRYYRSDVSRQVWAVVIGLALFAGLWFAFRAALRVARADERRQVLTEAGALERQLLDTMRELEHERDSLRVLTRERDTVLVIRVVQAKGEAAKPLPPASDTAALIAAVRSCRAQLDTLATDCDAFRHVATTALAKADTITRRDSAVIAGLSLQLAALRRADSVTATRTARAGRWRVLERGVCVGALASHVLRD